ncbi:hypothetical protein SD70_24980 [Gordoniibacillus kamchatkensis]|uniref:Uncharacterized protein n=1 Tax=Gordoniibacillus kamchatkensis TaxID=1590651 RepID=A0ABR5ADE5_9BACL|nr:hypothetical protein SD70_24980 [Paenibacillus sp. VKM B-2647]
MQGKWTHLYGVELLEPIEMDVQSGIELTSLFKAVPTKYLRRLSEGFSKTEKDSLLLDMVTYINGLISERTNLSEVFREVETMSPEFIEHVINVLRQMIQYEKRSCNNG